MTKRVVVTGLGVAAPNAIGVPQFSAALKAGISGIKHDPELERLLFSCQIAGKPAITTELTANYLTGLEQRNFNSNGILYGLVAGIEAWLDAGLFLANDSQRGNKLSEPGEPDWDSGTIFGAGTSGIDKFRESIYRVDDLQIRKLGSTIVIQTMVSGISAFLAGKLGLGNQVTTNSAACTTGVESILMGYERIKAGYAKRMLCGSTTDSGPYIWAGFDAMKVCTYKHNHDPEHGSRPMSASASGFVPGGGSGAMVLEDLESAHERGVRIYAEILGGEINSGGQCGKGSMTAPNPLAVQRCIENALRNANVKASDVDCVNAHLTATSRDSDEIRGWSRALGRAGVDFPPVNALKSMIGHCLSAAGSIESVAAVLQLHEGFIFPNLNCEDLHPEIAELVAPEQVPMNLIFRDLDVIAKASFGFGDVNACVLLKKYID